MESMGQGTGNVPDEECPWCWSDVGVLAGVIDVGRAGYCVDVGAQEEEVNYDVHNLEGHYEHLADGE